MFAACRQSGEEIFLKAGDLDVNHLLSSLLLFMRCSFHGCIKLVRFSQRNNLNEKRGKVLESVSEASFACRSTRA